MVTALRRRAPHVPVVLAPAAVQGAQAPAELVRALQSLYRLAEAGTLDVILLVRGGGSIEDLWAFNDEQLARTIVRSPVPLISGVGHETDFTIADFCADVRAPTPTAAAELAAQSRHIWLAGLESTQSAVAGRARPAPGHAGQRLDQAASRLGRPLARMATQQLRLGRGGTSPALRGARSPGTGLKTRFKGAQLQFRQAVQARLQRSAQMLDRSRLRMELLDPRLVLQRGYALLADEAGGPSPASVKLTRPSAGRNPCRRRGCSHRIATDVRFSS